MQNAAPSVSVTSPAANDTFYAPATITLAASASDSDGSVASVAFYAGSTLLTTDTSAPYGYTWSSVSAGSYSLTAVATDNLGVVTTSSAIGITVTAVGHVQGVSAWPSSVVTGQASTITVTGDSTPCSTVQINFGDGTVTPYSHAGSLSSSPLEVTHSWSSAGTKTVTATGLNDCAGTASATVTVSGNSPPSVSLTAPAAGTYTTGAAITLTASASDDYGVASVAFYDGSTLLATDTSAPWSYSWSSASEGGHTITARATDIYGLSTDSAGVSLTVQDIESVYISQAVPVAGQWSTVSVYGAASGCGAVTVNYGDGDVVTYAIDGLPISNYHLWTTGGSKTVTATGQGNCSGYAQASVTVDEPPTVSLTTPAANDTFYAPATITLTATASDSDGSVGSVAFYAGSTLVATDTSAPAAWFLWADQFNVNCWTCIWPIGRFRSRRSSPRSLSVGGRCALLPVRPCGVRCRRCRAW